MSTPRPEDQARHERLEAASIEAATSGIKALLLLNGAAAIALLSFLATVYDADMDTDRARLFDAATKSLVWFASGAGLSVVTSLIAHETNKNYATALLQKVSKEYEKRWAVGGRWHQAGIVAAVASIACFGAGVYRIWQSL